MKDDLVNLKKIVDEAREWMTDPVRRQRMHHPACTVHKPSAQCSCGVHKSSSGLAIVSHDLGVLAQMADELLAASETVIHEAVQREDYMQESWNPEAQVQLTLTIAEIRKLHHAIANTRPAAKSNEHK